MLCIVQFSVDQLQPYKLQNASTPFTGNVGLQLKIIFILNRLVCSIFPLQSPKGQGYTSSNVCFCKIKSTFKCMQCTFTKGNISYQNSEPIIFCRFDESLNNNKNRIRLDRCPCRCWSAGMQMGLSCEGESWKLKPTSEERTELHTQQGANALRGTPPCS